MAITAVFELPDMTQQRYDQIIKDLESKGFGAPDGRLHHVASASDNGGFVVDVWESEEKLGKFAEVLMPILASNGVTLPQPQIRPVHNIIKR